MIPPGSPPVPGFGVETDALGMWPQIPPTPWVLDARHRAFAVVFQRIVHRRRCQKVRDGQEQGRPHTRVDV